jgi:hypothetical protein
MPDFPNLGHGQKSENWGAATAASRGATITSSATANVKGTYTQLIATTGFEVDGVLVMADDQATGVDYLVDIAVGAAASEVVLLPNLLFTGATGSISYGANYFFNVPVKAGERISARCQASTLSSIIRISCLAFGVDFMASSPLGIVTAYGVATGTSGGTSVDPGATINTKGAYAQLVASTTAPIRKCMIAIGNQHNSARTVSSSWLLDIAIGGAGSEQVILSNLALNSSTSPDIVAPQVYGPIPIGIPSATRLAARSQCSDATAGSRTFDVAIYGES